VIKSVACCACLSVTERWCLFCLSGLCESAQGVGSAPLGATQLLIYQLEQQLLRQWLAVCQPRCCRVMWFHVLAFGGVWVEARCVGAVGGFLDNRWLLLKVVACFAGAENVQHGLSGGTWQLV
jgi:hypothetical protein